MRRLHICTALVYVFAASIVIWWAIEAQAMLAMAVCCACAVALSHITQLLKRKARRQGSHSHVIFTARKYVDIITLGTLVAVLIAGMSIGTVAHGELMVFVALVSYAAYQDTRVFLARVLRVWRRM